MGGGIGAVPRPFAQSLTLPLENSASGTSWPASGEVPRRIDLAGAEPRGGGSFFAGFWLW